MFSLFLYAFLGLFAGVLVNRAADNLPPPSTKGMLSAPVCPFCGEPRSPLEQLAVLSALVNRARCHSCRAPLSLRAPIVEIAGALLFAFLWDHFGPGTDLIIYSIFTVILLLVFVVDFEHRLILNVVVLPATLLAFLVSPLIHTNPALTPLVNLQRAAVSTLLGAASAYLIVFGIFILGGLFARTLARARGHELDEVAFGFGDVKLAGLVGALVGFPAIFFALVYTVLLGGIVSFGIVVFQLVSRRGYAPFMAIPYGPFFAVVGWAFMVWGSTILHSLLGV